MQNQAFLKLISLIPLIWLKYNSSTVQTTKIRVLPIFLKFLCRIKLNLDPSVGYDEF